MSVQVKIHTFVQKQEQQPNLETRAVGLTLTARRLSRIQETRNERLVIRVKCLDVMVIPKTGYMGSSDREGTTEFHSEIYE